MSDDETTATRDGGLLVVDSGAVQICADPDGAMISIVVPVALLAALRAALNHPQLVALIEATAPPSTLRLIA